MLAAGENHSGNPEENNVIPGDQHIRGVELLQILRSFRPAQGLKGPQGGAEPGIQHVRIPLDVGAAALFTLAGILPGHGNVTAVGTGPGRNLVTPPQLPGDTPIPHIFHPVQVGLGEALRNELGLPFLYHPDGFLCQGLHLHEPLGGDNGLHIVMAAVAGAHIVGVVLHLHQVALLLQILYNGLPGLVAVHTLVLAAVGVDLAVVVQHPDYLQVVAQTHLEVVGVMGRGHLHAAGTEVHLGVVVCHHRNFLVHQGQNHLLAHNGGVTLVIGVDTHAGIAQHGFRTGGSHNHLTGAVSQGVTDVPQVARLVHIFHLGVTQSGDAVGAPVDNPAALVDEALFVQGDEHFPHCLGAALVHGKPCPLPIAGGTQFLLLLYNPVTEFVLPVPDPLQELLPAQVVPGQSFFPQLLFHLNLGGDACVVHAGNPQGAVTLHSLEPNQGILQGGIHGVTHVQLAGDIGGRHNDGKGIGPFLLRGTEIPVILPHFIDFCFHLLGFVNLRQFLRHKKTLLFQNKKP